ncbi:hypothetical protein IFM61606_04830 [Aspergillus udagawae]|uniref:Uncharacterized protein n=1 Tax=Aspergillus udagawae TaxID=91492 RepID=A0A8E0R1T1_9EURO|nr:uncharacterized protein Aud_001879 [Aspergillus udagawae]GFG24906.1 hypothetical protein IFM61606_04830 [Aspergillus udagawae]GIC94550.1 hypothetical protein Aud_001879 [Aspergillus udagawae]
MATQIASPAAASGSGGRNPDRNNGDSHGPGKGKVKRAKKVARAKIHLPHIELTGYFTKGPVVFFLPTLGSRRCDVCVAARILAAVTAVSQNQGDLPPPPPPPPRPRGWQNRPRIPTAGTVVEIDAGCSTCNSKMQGEAQLRQVQGQEDERKQRVDSHHGEEKNTTCEADRQ